MFLPLNANFEGEAVRSRELPGLRIETWGTRRIAALDLELFLIVRLRGEIIGKLRGDLRSGVRDQKRNELGWGRRVDLGGWGVDKKTGYSRFGARPARRSAPREKQGPRIRRARRVGVVLSHPSPEKRRWMGHPIFLVGPRDEKQKQVPVRLRSGRAFGSAERRCARDDSARRCGATAWFGARPARRSAPKGRPRVPRGPMRV
jgi:hypothetical protein